MIAISNIKCNIHVSFNYIQCQLHYYRHQKRRLPLVSEQDGVSLNNIALKKRWVNVMMDIPTPERSTWSIKKTHPGHARREPYVRARYLAFCILPSHNVLEPLPTLIPAPDARPPPLPPVPALVPAGVPTGGRHRTWHRNWHFPPPQIWW